MELYAFRSLAPEEPLREMAGSSGQLRFMLSGSGSRPDRTDILDRLTTYSSQTMVCMMSSDCGTAARPVNSYSVRGIVGYTHPAHDNLEHPCLDVLTYLNRHMNSTGGLLTVHGSRQEAQLPLPSIYHIETVKGTHMCSIHCSNGEYVFRSGIKESLEKLGPSFRQVRAPTIANLPNVWFSEPNLGILPFTGGVSCCCSHNYKYDLSDYSCGHPGHTCAERGGG